MKFKILETTDGKYVGETVEIKSTVSVGESIEYKGINFKIEKIKVKVQYITFYCTNYSVLAEVLES